MKKIILDIDSVGDDILAAIFGMLNKDIELLGITTVLGASGCVKHATNVALKIRNLVKSDVKVYMGEEKPIGNVVAVDGDPVNFADELKWKFGSRLDKFNEEYEDLLDYREKESAVDFIIRTVNDNPGQVLVVATGPLTNIAKAIEKDAGIVNKIKKLYILGGTFKSPGNITPVVEYNIWGDPEAAKMVFDSGADIILVPLDVCENNDFASGMLTRDDLFDLQEYSKGEVVDYIVEKFPIYIDLWREYFALVGFPMDDVITLALAVDESLCTYSDKVHIEVELEGKFTRGQTIMYHGAQIVKNKNADNKNVRVAIGLDGKKIIKLFKDTIGNSTFKSL